MTRTSTRPPPRVPSRPSSSRARSASPPDGTSIVYEYGADTLLSVGLVVVVAVILHNGLGLGLGYAIAKACRLDVPGRRAVSIEVGMQNSGLAAALAAAHFNPVAALPAAIFSVWHNVSGSILASYWSRRSGPAVGAGERSLASGNGR